MKKITVFIISLVLIGLAIWYFFIKSYDYQITFRSRQSPGTIYSNLIAWNNWETPKNRVVSNIHKEPFKRIVQEFKVSDSIFKIEWLLSKESDSITKITALLSDKNNDFTQRLKIPFVDTDFKNRSLSTVKKIRKGLRIHENDYRVSSVEKANIPEKNVAYIELGCKLHEKAKIMIKHTIDVMEHVRNNNIELTADPFLEITSWDLEQDYIQFNFCFPIPILDKYPKSDKVKIKTIPSRPALKTIFNGNYKISDRGWFHLLDYADRNKINVKNLPIEFFLNDPHSGGDELKWKAEIYMPLIE